MLFETSQLMVFDNLWLSIIEYVYIGIVWVEFILKLISDGFIFTPHAFLRNFQGIFKLYHLTIATIHLFYFWSISPSKYYYAYSFFIK